MKTNQNSNLKKNICVGLIVFFTLLIWMNHFGFFKSKTKKTNDSVAEIKSNEILKKSSTTNDENRAIEKQLNTYDKKDTEDLNTNLNTDVALKATKKTDKIENKSVLIYNNNNFIDFLNSYDKKNKWSLTNHNAYNIPTEIQGGQISGLSTESKVLNFFSKLEPLLALPKGSLSSNTLEKKITSRNKYYIAPQTISGYPVFGAYFKVVTSNTGKGFLLLNQTKPIASEIDLTKKFSLEDAREALTSELPKLTSTEVIKATGPIIWTKTKTPQLAYLFDTNSKRYVISAKELSILDEQNLKVH